MKYCKRLFLCLLGALAILLTACALAGPEKDSSPQEMVIETVPAEKAVSITADGVTMVVNTASVLVGDILNEAQITLGPEDRVIPALQEECTDSIIQVIRTEKKVIEEKTGIPFRTSTINDVNLLKGEQKVVQKGVKGLEKKSYEILLEDGQEVARKLLTCVLVKEPVAQVVAVGTKQTVSRGGETIYFEKTLRVTATAYTHTGSHTYTGIEPQVGIVAVDPKVIPLGTRLYIDGYGYATAMDIGSSIKGNRIDVFLDTKEECLKWGRKKVDVFVLARE